MCLFQWTDLKIEIVDFVDHQFGFQLARGSFQPWNGYIR